MRISDADRAHLRAQWRKTGRCLGYAAASAACAFGALQAVTHLPGGWACLFAVPQTLAFWLCSRAYREID